MASLIPALILSPDDLLAGDLERTLNVTGGVSVVRRIGGYPREHELLRMLRAHAPRLVFVDVAAIEEALEAIASVEAQAPGAYIIAVARQARQADLVALMRAGVREFVSLDGAGDEVAAAVARSAAALAVWPDTVAACELMTFLPSKPGAGCSTVAANAAVALAGLPESRVLLADFDLNCGMIGFLLHLTAERSIVDAAEHAAVLDEQIWPKLVVSRGALDVIPAGPMQPGFRIDPAQVRYVINFARRNYTVVCADLSGLMERFAVELMHESKYIFLVCTPELGSVYLARQKLDFLRSLELGDRVRVLLNRAQRGSPVNEQEVEKVVGLPVWASFPNDYRRVDRAVREGRPVESSSELGRRFQEFARRIVSKDPPARPQRFIEYFTLSPARFALERKGKAKRDNGRHG
ncbi:MAG TPA: hypothetical protein VN428_05755 [Bryobacteraceae bacterium]|nr:hypothetical protein [Bryobacteraceae bacterium]